MIQFEAISKYKDNIKLPTRSTQFSAGYDFYAQENIEIYPTFSLDIYNKDKKLKWYQKLLGINKEHNHDFDVIKPDIIPTGVKIKLPDNMFLGLYNRSSMSIKRGIMLANCVGIIDADYYNNINNEGEICFAFYNFSSNIFQISKGDKIGQGIIQPFFIIDDDNCTNQRTGGIGSTDKLN